MNTYLIIGMIVALIALALGLYMVFKPSSNSQTAQVVTALGGTVTKFTNVEKFTGTTECDEVIFTNKQSFIDNPYCAFKLFNKVVLGIEFDTLTDSEKTAINAKVEKIMSTEGDNEIMKTEGYLFTQIRTKLLKLDVFQMTIFNIGLLLNLNNDTYLTDGYAPYFLFLIKVLLAQQQDTHYLNYNESSKIITFGLSDDKITDCVDVIAQNGFNSLENNKCYQIILSKMPNFVRNFIAAEKIHPIKDINTKLLQTIQDDLTNVYIDMLIDNTLTGLGYKDNQDNQNYVIRKLTDKYTQLQNMQMYKDITDIEIINVINKIYTLNSA